MSEKIVKSELVVKATAALNAEIEKELEEQDPSQEKAKAILLDKEENSEDTQGNDGE